MFNHSKRQVNIEMLILERATQRDFHKYVKVGPVFCYYHVWFHAQNLSLLPETLCI